jgi:hypothetical protein
MTLNRMTPGMKAGISEYVKRAFLYRWNLLLFTGGVAAAALTPWPDALLPLLAAAEMAYLSGLVAIPKFRRAVDAEFHARMRRQQIATGAGSINAILVKLTPESRRRFDEVRGRCLEMRTIAEQVRGRGGSSKNEEDLSTPALDRLLWVFLRLLISREALQRFLACTNEGEIRARLAEAHSRLSAQGGADERIVRSLQDAVAAHRLRLENLERASRNIDFVNVELDRIEAKIHAITESSVNRQDPELMSSQIDSVAETMHSTERAISEMQAITGLIDEMQEPPSILEANLVRVKN